MSLRDSLMPKSLKTALIRPLLKKTGLDSDILKNYRPVSNLTFISKVIERVVSGRLNEHLIKNSMFDRVLSLRQHVSYTSKTYRFHLRNISRIRKYIPQDTSVVLVKSLVMSRLDYSNGLFYGLPKCTVSGLQAVQNSAARIVTQERLRDHDSMSRALIGLHWLPVDNRIEYKLLLYTYKALHDLAPGYLCE